MAGLYGDWEGDMMQGEEATLGGKKVIKKKKKNKKWTDKILMQMPKESRSAARAGKGLTAKEKEEVKKQKAIRKTIRKYHTQKR